METGYYTRQEIFSQPTAWTEALTVLNACSQEIYDLRKKNDFGQIVFTGCGSTYYLALTAASLNQELTGIPSRAFPASELWLYPKSSFTAVPTLLVAISRSGETTETLRACESFLAHGRGQLLTFSCYEDMPLAKMGAVNVVLRSGQEKSIAQTRAFSTLFLGAIATACIWADRGDLFDKLGGLPEAGAKLLNNYAGFAAELGRDKTIDRFYWLGSGPRYGLASELSLKMKEMSLSHSEPFHFMEFRHGPISMVTPSTLVIGLQSSENAGAENEVLNDVKKLGGNPVNIAEKDAKVQFEGGLDEAIRSVLYLPFGQIIAFERALSKGLDPDRPTNLNAVVKLQ